MTVAPKYNMYHCHSFLSNGTINVDSVTNFREYVELAQKHGMTALGISEHGNIFEWVHKKEAIEAAGLKYLHCIEAYVTEDEVDKPHLFSAVDILSSENKGKGKKKKELRVQFQNYWKAKDGKTLIKTVDANGEDKIVWIDPETIKDEGYKKQRDNYHVVLIAKNFDGVRELNKLTSIAANREDHHYYYAPRITISELLSTSENIIITSACLGGVLYKGNPVLKEKMISFMVAHKDRCFLEIQHHLCAEQKEYNHQLYELHKVTGIPLIVGTDTHAVDADQMECRRILRAGKTDRNSYENDDELDLTFKSPQELLEIYKKQNAVPIDEVITAMNNTVVLSDMVESFVLDRTPKYPKLYPNSEEIFQQKINEGFINRGINKKPNVKEYIDRIHYEYDTYKHNNAIDFMLLEEDYKSEMRRRNIRFGYSRGSVSGSIIAYLLGITEMDSVKYNLNFERFMSKERVSLADIDTDWFADDRKIVREYLYSKPGLYCCEIVTFNTIALKGAIKDICRGMFRLNIENLDMPSGLKTSLAKWEKEKKANGNKDAKMPDWLSKQLQQIYEEGAIYKEVPFEYLSFSEELIRLAESDEDKAKKKYPRIFKNVDIAIGCVVSVGNHPSACVVSPYPVDEWFGTFTTSTNERPISVINMKEIDSLNFVKLDILGLDNIGLIYKTCDAAGIPFATPDNIPPDDIKVWESIRDDTTMIFQWESKTATDYLKQLLSNETIAKIKERNPNITYMDLFSIGNGAIRPAGESYRDALACGEYRDNGHKALNDFLASTLGFLVYQEEVMEFLHRFCGYTMGQADIVRRGFAKKTGTEEFVPQIKSGFIETMEDEYKVDEYESQKLIVDFVQVIKDASSYLFSKNHADPYSWIGYICGYLRYYYPLQFITTALNIFKTDIDKTAAITRYAKKIGIRITPIQFRHSGADYGFDLETNEIYKGIASIKGIGANVADKLFLLKDKQYNSFLELLYDLTKISITKSQRKILIELDFFREFGHVNYLLKIANLYDAYNDRKELNKETLPELGLEINSIRSCIIQEKAKIITIDSQKLLELLVQRVKGIRPRTLKETIMAQKEHLGYIDIVDPKYARMLVVMEINTKYSPRLQVYSLKNGTTLECKIDKKTFNKTKLEEGDIIYVTGQISKPKSRKTEDGWEPIPGTNEIWLTKYQIRNLL